MLCIYGTVTIKKAPFNINLLIAFILVDTLFIIVPRYLI